MTAQTPGLGATGLGATGRMANSLRTNSLRTGPDDRGFFGIFGGRFVAETLMPLILELEAAYNQAKDDPAFHETLRRAFLAIVEAEPERCAVIDARPSEGEVAAAIWATVRARLGAALNAATAKR